MVDNAFGILAQRWQVLLGTMQQEPENGRLIVEACVCLHNLMRIRYPALQNAAMDRENDNHDVVLTIFQFASWSCALTGRYYMIV